MGSILATLLILWLLSLATYSFSQLENPESDKVSQGHFGSSLER